MFSNILELVDFQDDFQALMQDAIPSDLAYDDPIALKTSVLNVSYLAVVINHVVLALLCFFFRHFLCSFRYLALIFIV